ncbi:RHS repeat-associated core domain-containing protein [Variovorax sp. KK3]|uniref:RHS repeat-associated core domain-containing protein n=1 Tax=Variovorax sp. KK3 TaxID=1855728 RepID=UPI003AAE5ECA
MSCHPRRTRAVRAICFALQASLLALPASAGTIRTEYDAAGLPSAITDASGQVTRIQRDAISRPTRITYADGKSSTLVYDGPNSIGHLSSFTDRSGTTTYTRDIYGRVTAKTQALANGFRQQIGYGFTSAGLLASITYPGGSILGLGYDATGRLIQLNWNGNPLVTGITWNPMGQPTAWTWAFAPGVRANRTYDTAARLTQTEFSSYTWDAAGRITSLTQKLFVPSSTNPAEAGIAQLNVVSYIGYDAVGRVVRFNGPDHQASFTYDANGNRTGSSLTRNGQTTTRDYAVPADSNRIEGFTQTLGGTTTRIRYGYDANGGMTSDGLRTYSYDAEGRLSAVTTGATDRSPTTRYAHNLLGQRVFKTEPLYAPSEGDEKDPGFFQSLVGFFTTLWGPGANEAEKQGYAFMYDEEGSLLSETGTGGANSAGSTQYIYLPTSTGPMLIAAVIDGNLHAVHSDHLNTPRGLTNSQGQVVWQWAYSAFGEDKPTISKYRFANLDINPNPGMTNETEVIFNKRYDGQYYDKESGLHYNVNRTYFPALGRYTQPDPTGLFGGPNRFGYVAANPLSYSDPEGLVRQSGRPLDILPLEGGGGGMLGGGGTGIRGTSLPPRPASPTVSPAPQVPRPAAGELMCRPANAGRTKDVPNRADPGSIIEGNHRTREYGVDGRPVRDYDKAHQGYERPHVHDWDGGVREHPGRDYSPWPRGEDK